MRSSFVVEERLCRNEVGIERAPLKGAGEGTMVLERDAPLRGRDGGRSPGDLRHRRYLRTEPSTSEAFQRMRRRPSRRLRGLNSPGRSRGRLDVQLLRAYD